MASTSQSGAKAPPSPFDTLERITKAAGLVLAVSYALGMLVSNQYLIALGTSDFSSIRPRYILTGLWTLLLIVLSVFPVLLPTVALTALAHKNVQTSAVYRVTVAAMAGTVGLFIMVSGGAVLLMTLRFDFRWMNQQKLIIDVLAIIPVFTCVTFVGIHSFLSSVRERATLYEVRFAYIAG